MLIDTIDFRTSSLKKKNLYANSYNSAPQTFIYLHSFLLLLAGECNYWCGTAGEEANLKSGFSEVWGLPHKASVLYLFHLGWHEYWDHRGRLQSGIKNSFWGHALHIHRKYKIVIIQFVKTHLASIAWPRITATYNEKNKAMFTWNSFDYTLTVLDVVCHFERPKYTNIENEHELDLSKWNKMKTFVGIIGRVRVLEAYLVNLLLSSQVKGKVRRIGNLYKHLRRERCRTGTHDGGKPILFTMIASFQHPLWNSSHHPVQFHHTTWNLPWCFHTYSELKQSQGCSEWRFW